MTPEEAAAFEDCIARGGVALFPADTVYGLACDPESREAVERLYALKGRPPAQPAAVMFFALEPARAALAGLAPRTGEVLGRILPGAITAILPNPAGLYPLACGPRPDRLGVRVPDLRGELEPLTAVGRPVLQSSANPSGGPDPRRAADVDPSIAAGVDLALDGGELPGTPSTVVDLSEYESTGAYEILREGAVAREDLAERL